MSSKVTDNLLCEVAVNGNEKEHPTKEDFCDNDATDCTWEEIIYGAGDMIFGSVVVAPAVVGCWRGAWGLLELHGNLFPYVQTYFLGIIIHVCFALLRSFLLSRSRGAWSSLDGGAGRWLFERVLSRVYMYVFLVACIIHWRGGWGIFDALVEIIIPDKDDPHRPVVIACLLSLLLVAMGMLRSARNILAPPYFIVTDGKDCTYIFTTRFRQTSSRETALYILDCVFSVAVVGSLVVFVWRGSWALLDIYLFPEDPAKSFWISLIGGYTLVVITFGLQAPLRWAAARLHGAPRLLLADVYHLLSFAATVNVWRGVWGLLDVYLFPVSPRLSNWCSHVASLALLMLLNCSNSALVRGVYIDAEEPAGECVVFPCHYLRLFFHKERTKKRHRRALAAAAAAAARHHEDASLTPLHLPCTLDEKV